MKLSPIASNFTLKDHVYEKLRDAITEMDIYRPGRICDWTNVRLPNNWGYLGRRCAKR